MNEFTSYWKALPPEDKEKLARRMRTSRTYLSHLAHGHRCPSERFHELLEIATGERFVFECRAETT